MKNREHPWRQSYPLPPSWALREPDGGQRSVEDLTEKIIEALADIQASKLRDGTEAWEDG